MCELQVICELWCSVAVFLGLWLWLSLMGDCGVFVDCCSAEQTQKVADSSAMDTYTFSNLVSSAAHMAGDAYRVPSLWGSWSCIELWATGCSDCQW
jgi:hypothetical protein